MRTGSAPGHHVRPKWFAIAGGLALAIGTLPASAAVSPILDYDLTQGSGTTVVDSVNGVVGTTHGTVWSTDPIGTPVLYFDNPIDYRFGDGDYFAIPDHAGLDSPEMSIEAIVYPMDAGYYTTFAERVRDGGTFETNMSLGLQATGYTTGTQPNFHLQIGGADYNVVAPDEIPLNAWSHIIGTYDGNDIRLYVDGALVATELGVGGPRDTGSNPLYLGHAPTSNHYFNGYYKSFKFHDRALTAQEVAAEFNAPPVADANGPYNGFEGSPVSLDATSSSDPDAATGDSIVAYEWDTDDDGAYNDATGAVVPQTFGDDGTYTVGLRVADSFGASDTDETTVTVSNVAPTVDTPIVVPEPSYEGQAVTASSSFSDPGFDDAPFTCTVDYGAGPVPGVVAGATCTGPSHVYGDAGLHNVTVTVTDKDGGTGGNSTTHEVIAPAPILDYDLTQGSGTTVVDSVNGVVGTTHGTVWSTDPIGTPVLYFDNPIDYRFGDGDYFAIPDHAGLDSPEMSIEAIVYPMDAGYYTTFAERVRDGGTFETNMSLGLQATGYTTGTQPNFHLQIGGADYNVVAPDEIPLNAWSHIIGTYDGNDIRLYVDGVLVATELGVDGPRDTGSNPLYLGHAPTSNHYFNGYYKSFKLYDQAINAPTAADDAYGTDEDSLLSVAAAGVLGNDTDAEHDELSAVLVSAPSDGTLTLNADGSFSYDPDTDFHGTDSFTYDASDGALSDQATVTITVNAINDAPMAGDDSYTTDEDTLLTVAAPGVLDNDTDVDGDALSAVLVAGPSDATLTLNADGSFDYDPDADFHGTDSFTYDASDGALSDQATVTITVNPINDAPMAGDDSYATDEDTLLTVAAPGVLDNDTDVDGDALSAVLVAGPSDATLTLNADGSFDYDPDTDFHGTDSFTYDASDGGLTDTATVTITVNPVNDAPVAVDDSAATDEDVAVSLPVAGLLVNDGDVDGDALTVVGVAASAATHGTVSLVSGAPAPVSIDFSVFPGPDQLLGTGDDVATDPGISSGDTVIVNDDPARSYAFLADGPNGVLFESLSFAGRSGSVVKHGSDHVLVSDADGVDGGSSSYSYADMRIHFIESGTPSSPLLRPVSAVSVTVIDAVGGFPPTVVFRDQSGAVLHSETAPYESASWIPHVISFDDSAAGSRIAMVDITTNFSMATTAVTFTSADPAEDVLYTPDPDYHGPASFAYEVSDGVASDTGTVTITVAAVNDVPVAADDAYATDEDALLSVAAPGVLGNDSDVDVDPLTAAVVTGPSNGTLTLLADGSFTYDPDPDRNGTDSFTYYASDGALADTATVTITVNPVNDTPVAADDSATTDEDTAVSIDLLANDSAGPPDEDPTLSFVSLAQGEIVGWPESVGVFYFDDHVASASGVQVAWSRGNSNPTTRGSFYDSWVTNDDTWIAKAVGVGDVSEITDASVFTYVDRVVSNVHEGEFVVIHNTSTGYYGALRVDAYRSEDGTTVMDATWYLQENATGNFGSGFVDPDHGTLVGNGDGTVTYTPDQDFNGTDSFQYTVVDGDGASDAATVTIAVNAVNDAPVATDDAYSTDEDSLLNVAAPGVLGNDTDVDEDPLTASVVAGPSSGTLSLLADGSFSYDPGPDFNGTDSFTYDASDGALSDAATVTITVNAVNDAPVAADDAYATDEETLLSVAAPGVLGDDTDVDGDTLSAVLVSGPSNGTLTLGADGSFTYDPDSDFNGTDSFIYDASDGTLTDQATVTITINAVNDTPIAADDAYATDEDTLLSVAAPGVVGDDTDVDGDTLSAVLVSGPSNGTLTLGADGSFSYDPDPDFNGVDSFTYDASDGALTDTATVTITVDAVNDTPAAGDDAYTTDEDTLLSVAAPGVLGNDTDVDGDALTAGPTFMEDFEDGDVAGWVGSSPGPGGNGTFEVVATPSSPSGGTYVGRQTFGWSCYGWSFGGLDPVTPSQMSWYFRADGDTGHRSGLGFAVTEADGWMTKIAYHQGALEYYADGYHHIGPASMGTWYLIELRNIDWNGSPYNTFDIWVDGVEKVVGARFMHTVVDEVSGFIHFGCPFATGPTYLDDLTFDLGPSHGTLTLDAEGSFSYDPDPDFNGVDSFTYDASDGALTDTATVTITVDAVNDTPAAGDDAYTTDEDTLLSVAAPGVLGNDTDVDGDALTAGPTFMEDFEDGDVAGWVGSSPGPGGNGTFEVVATPSSPSGGTYVGRQTFGWSCYGWSFGGLDPVTPSQMSWYFRADGDTGHRSGLGFAVTEADGWMTKIAYHQGALEYYADGYHHIGPASMGTWYLIELRNIDWNGSPYNTFDIWVDGVEKVVGARFMHTVVDEVSGFIHFGCPFATGPTYLDDLTFDLGPSHGTLTLDADGSFSYDAGPGLQRHRLASPTRPTTAYWTRTSPP